MMLHRRCVRPRPGSSHFSETISYFKHAGQDDFLALGVAVVDVGQAQDRTTLLVDEAARRVGFDVQIRYTRIDERETASIEKIKI